MDRKSAKQSLKISREHLDNCLSGKQGESGTISRTAASKCRAHFEAASKLLDMSSRRSGVDRTRLVMSAFDATWMGWNTLYARTMSLAGSGDRKLHLQVADHARHASPALQSLLQGAVAGFADALLRETRKQVGSERRSVRQPVHAWVATAGAGAAEDNKVHVARKRLAHAADAGCGRDAHAARTAAVEGLYELRCRRMHGDLVANTAGSRDAMERLCCAATALTALLVASPVATGVGVV